MRPTAIDLFSGVGGLSLGLEQAGFDVIAVIESDPVAALMHKLNFPTTKVICKDICKVTKEEIFAITGGIPPDLIAGGPPCQGYSSMGKKLMKDPRNKLTFHFARLVGELAPRAFLLENVRGMHEGGSKQLLDELIEQLRNCGYKVLLPYRMLCASHFGVPQERSRLFVLGARKNCALETPLHWPKNTTVPRKVDGSEVHQSWPIACPTVREAIWDLLPIDKAPNEDVFMGELGPTQSQYASYLRGGAVDPDDYGYRRKIRCPGLSGNDKSKHADLIERRFAGARTGAVEPITHFFKLAPEGLCNTLRAGTDSAHGGHTAPRPIHPTMPRCITVREAARLHSYPDWFRFHATIWHGFRHIGNSVPPLLGRALGKCLLESLGYKREKPFKPIAMGPDEWASLPPLMCVNHFRHEAKRPRRRKDPALMKNKPARMYTDEDKAKVYAHLLEGNGVRDTAEAFGMWPSVVSRILNEWAVHRNPIKEDPDYVPLKKPPKPPPNCAIGAKGEDHYSSKLTNAERNEILEALAKAGDLRGTLSILARQYGVSVSTIREYKSLLKAGKSSY